jgi:hypothetical protein
MFIEARTGFFIICACGPMKVGAESIVFSFPLCSYIYFQVGFSFLARNSLMGLGSQKVIIP